MNTPEKKSKGVLETVHQTKHILTRKTNLKQPFFGENCSHPKQQQKKVPMRVALVFFVLSSSQPEKNSRCVCCDLSGKW